MKKLGIFVCMLAIVALFAACGDTTQKTDSDATTVPSASESVDNKKSNAENSSVFYEDKTLKATYKGISEMSGIVMLNVTLENKTDEEITVLPMDSSVDDTMVQFTSGVPATMQGGKKMNQAWIIGTKPKKDVSLSLSICDKDMHELKRTDVLTIDTK